MTALSDKQPEIMKVNLFTLAFLIVLPGCVPGDKQETQNQASVTIHVDKVAGPYDPMIFGGFIEHFGRQIYGGFFEPGSPLSDEQGFRLDVIDALIELKVPVIRWPSLMLPPTFSQGDSCMALTERLMRSSLRAPTAGSIFMILTSIS